MAELRAAFEADGYDAVGTYIQSGNVLFETDAPQGLEATLERHLGLRLVVVVRSHRQLRDVVSEAPGQFGSLPDTYLYDVIFLKDPLSSRQALRVVHQREGVDQAWGGSGVVYFARLKARRAQSRMSRIVATPEYQRMTIRSWATTTRLLELLDARDSG